MLGFRHVPMFEGGLGFNAETNACGGPTVQCLRLTFPSAHVPPGGELVLFEQSEVPIEVVAEGQTRFVLGSATQHPHELVLGNYSVHTSQEALARGETEIRRIGRTLRAEGKQNYALRLFG